MRIIVAADKNWAIGKADKMLVNIPADMKRFRRETAGKVLVMGRKRLQSFPGGLPLKGRTNIVLTGDRNFCVKGALIVHSLEELFSELKNYDTDDVYVIGGESVFRQLLQSCSEAYVTRIDYAYAADRYFPDLDKMPEWRIEETSEEQTYFDLEYTFVKYVHW